MKLSENWLREWVDTPASIEQIGERLLMGGLELEIEPVTAEVASGVVVGRILKADRHPQADRLQVCEVDAGDGRLLQIVCGAANARPGLKVPCALVGAKLPGGLEIRQAQLRGVDSFGMLCAAAELGLADRSDGLLELAPDAVPGTPIERYLDLADKVLNLEITPNRGDCLSALGLAREVAALFAVPCKRPAQPQTLVVGHRQLRIDIEDTADCPAYSGRIISGIRRQAHTPDWMRERLRRAGVRCVHPVVDVTNYVMLELGQPLHAFDLARLRGDIRVRRARPGESLKLLNEQNVELQSRELVIADDGGPIAVAGVMGGAASGVGEDTVDVFLESASFAAAAIAGTARRHKLSSDAAYRFERGVDPGIQRLALERATQLIVQLCGGEVHPLRQAGRAALDPVSVRLRHARISQLLGHDIPAQEVESLLARLGISLHAEVGGTWSARIPSHRSDLRLEVDLIEEVARLYGYDRIPARPYAASLVPSQPREGQRSRAQAQQLLVARGWQETVNLAFAEPGLQQRLAPGVEAVPVDNPIADPLSVMRSTLWAGLLPAWLHNRQRQQSRLRLFEFGVCFELRDGAPVEHQRLAGLAVGAALPEQWDSKTRAVDFYDVKADLIALFGAAADAFRFEAAEHPALHPGRSARILRGDTVVGWLGQLHPGLAQTLDLPEAPILFELDWLALREQPVPRARALSEFPSSRRDLAVVVGEDVPAQALIDCARAAGGSRLTQVTVFDIYRGPGLRDACKSVAFGLIFNDYSRTLTDEEIEEATRAISQSLTEQLGASIRQ